MLRVRFYTSAEDWRPVKWPPVGPCWCTGYTGDMEQAVAVAYVEKEDQILEYWPDATNIDPQEVDKIVFTSRFGRPDWWPEGKETL